ncbi:MAG: hypothetical protein II837_03045 [Treponema sp.]|nr:hypothetical protein [Treponema sp.]MBQ7168244.1 hypothetical protein [Treponema sp.]
MISLDQVLLLQKKVETAVGKINFLTGQISQLKNDNDALRTKCAELTKALDEKTELVSSLEANQGKIEEGILTALNRLDTVENAVLDGEGPQATGTEGNDSPVTAASQGADDEEVEDDDAPAFDYTGGTNASEESQELKEVTEEIADATNTSTDVQVNEVASDAESPAPAETPAESSAPAPAAETASSTSSEGENQDADSLNGQFDIF